jgi:hypothetical protein
MKKLFGILGNTLGIVLLIGMIVVLIFSLNGIKQGKDDSGTFDSLVSTPIPETEPTPIPLKGGEPAETIFESPLLPTATATLTPLEPEPTVTPTSVAEHPPLCKFEGAKEEIKEPESLLDRYVFSEPKAVLSYSGAIEISQWLPDNQRILINQRDNETGLETIETFNINTGETVKYGGGRLQDTMPPSHKFIWISDSESVAYVTIESDQYLLHISDGKKTPEIATTDLASLYLAPRPDGQDVTFVARTNLAQPQVYNVPTKRFQPVNPNSKTEQPAPEGYIDFWQQYQMAWKPNGEQYVWFNNQAFYLINVTTGNMCEVDLGTAGDHGKRWALFAEWSPNGRYLALLSTAGEPIFPFINLLVLDTISGEIQKIDVEGNKIVYGMTWSTNNRELLVVTPSVENTYEHQLFLVDIVTTKLKMIKTESPLIGTGYWGIDWATDGKHIAVSCPTLVETEQTINTGQLCVMDVEVR